MSQQHALPIVTPDSLHPRDAAARTRAARLARRHRGRRLLALAASIAVPAMAAPADWQKLDFGSGEAAAQPPQLLGFEVPGESFPGSAFYYLADEPYLPPGYDPESGTPASPAPADKPFAKSFAFAGSALDNSRAMQCLTLAIYYEAATEPDAGQSAVAQVVLNRVAHPAYPNTVCGVVFQGSERETGCQFSFTCDGSLARKPSPSFWNRARKVAAAALGGAVYRPAGLATHYHTTQIHPYWADSLERIGTIGAHHFYRWRGTAGLPSAFSAAYRGREPLAAPHPRSYRGPAASLLDPIALARAFEQDHQGIAASAPVPAEPVRAAGQTAAQGAVREPAPIYADEVRERGGDALFSGKNLPGSGDVKPEYAQSGQWIVQP